MLDLAGQSQGGDPAADGPGVRRVQLRAADHGQAPVRIRQGGQGRPAGCAALCEGSGCPRRSGGRAPGLRPAAKTSSRERPPGMLSPPGGATTAGRPAPTRRSTSVRVVLLLQMKPSTEVRYWRSTWRYKKFCQAGRASQQRRWWTMATRGYGDPAAQPVIEAAQRRMDQLILQQQLARQPGSGARIGQGRGCPTGPGRKGARARR